MTAPLQFLTDSLATPIGQLIYICDSQGALRMVDWSDHEARALRLLDIHYGKGGYTVAKQRDPFGLTTRFAVYFAGEIHAIDDIPTATAGTAFQREVWRALRAIPAAETISYGQLAERIGRPRAVRAVGLANGSNPIGVVVPCHRVIGANGALTGYGGGLPRKEWLLAHERAHTPSNSASAPQSELAFSAD
ncbi:MAG: methylated-DNA-[protein]-cysteine S-methyltransferase [Acidobacteriaceae bacterium]|jgi:methylated-DNA-[protein]-cysteine S-methyltransferase|nr:methylated-DNA-[protein]-cysteine S-methyltransferase [Acidobacteriaceae bacterium]